MLLWRAGLRILAFTALLPVLLCGTTTDAIAGDGFCFRGRPLPECRSFLITEVGYSRRLNGPSDERHYFNGDFGWMRNLNERYALGGTAFVGALTGPTLHFRVGVRPRIRYWLSKTTSLDGSIGPFIAPVTVQYTPEELADPNFFADPSDMRLGAAAQVGINLEDKVSFSVMAEALSAERASPPQPDVNVYVGGRLGSKTGLVGMLAAGVILAVAGLAVSGL